MKWVSRSLCAALAAILLSWSAWCDPPEAAADSYSSLSLDALARKMKEAASFPAVRIKAQVCLHTEKAEQPVLSEEVTAIVSGPRSRVERHSMAAGATGELKGGKTTVSVFDGRQYRKLTTFQDGRKALAWEGSENGNAREIGDLLFGGLGSEQVDDFELNPSHYFEVYNQNSGLFEIHSKTPPLSIVYVDPEHGFLVKHVENFDEDGDVQRACEVTFRQNDGRWFPAEQHIDSYFDGKLRPDSIIQIAPPETDPAVDPALFQVSFPPDARVMPATLSLAEIEKMRAESGLEGKEKELATASNALGETVPPPQEALPKDASETAPAPLEPKPRSPWTPLNAVTVIALGVLLGLYWRARRRQ